MSEHKISVNTLLNIYQGNRTQIDDYAILQILGFQKNVYGPDTQLIIRLSDSIVFLDCLLIGSYSIKNGKIIYHGGIQPTVEFNIHDLVVLADIFIKIDDKRMCPLQIVVRRIELAQRVEELIGSPSEVRQYFHNKKQSKRNQIDTQITLNNGNYDGIVKIQEDFCRKGVNQLQKNISIQVLQKSQKEICFRDQNQPLTYEQILKNIDGFFIGRLLRMKLSNKETKDGIISVLYLGFVDKKCNMVRINMAGRMAIKEYKHLQKSKCYYIKGLQIFKNEKMQHPQIRLKDKDSKIIEVQSNKIIQQFPSMYYRWDHENDSVDMENVDVIGIVEDIEEKTSYSQSNSQDSREVVRIILRNKFKVVKVSFWAEQIKILKALNLYRKEPLLLEDIKKKKNMFLDFTFESSVFRLKDDKNLLQYLENLLPEPQEKQNPANIKQFQEIISEEPMSNKVRILRVFLSRLQQNRIIYRLCHKCRKKVQKYADQCPDCQSTMFYYKYNCQLEFADYSGSFNCVAFEYSAQKLFNKTASEINDLQLYDMTSLIESCLFREYLVGVENKSSRLIIRSIEKLEQEQYLYGAKENLAKLKKILKSDKL